MRIPAVRPISFQPVKKIARGPKPSRTSRGPAWRTTAPTPIGAGSTASPAVTPIPGGCSSASLTGPASLAMAACLPYPGAAPSPVCGDQLVGLRRAPGARRISLHRRRLIQQWLDDTPGLLDAVLAHEVGAVPLQRGLQQHLVGGRSLAALA